MFRDCDDLGSNAVEDNVQQAFENKVTKLCEICVNRVNEYSTNQVEANKYKALADDLNENSYYSGALDWCNKALQMRPDNARMKELKQQIESKR